MSGPSTPPLSNEFEGQPTIDCNTGERSESNARVERSFPFSLLELWGCIILCKGGGGGGLINFMMNIN